MVYGLWGSSGYLPAFDSVSRSFLLYKRNTFGKTSSAYLIILLNEPSVHECVAKRQNHWLSTQCASDWYSFSYVLSSTFITVNHQSPSGDVAASQIFSNDDFQCFSNNMSFVYDIFVLAISKGFHCLRCLSR